MAPQTPTLNRIYWKALETACRKWAMTEDTLYIVCGPIYKSKPNTIGHSHKVSIPDAYFKVVLSLRRGHAKAIGFYYTNTSAQQSLSETATTVDQIEKLTGIDFFSSLEDTLEEQLESRFNLKDWR